MANLVPSGHLVYAAVVQEGNIRKTMAARGLVNGRGPHSGRDLVFRCYPPELLTPPKKTEADLLGQPHYSSVLMCWSEKIENDLYRVECSERNLDKECVPVAHGTVPEAWKLESLEFASLIAL